ncbi:HAD family hydrolase [Candidatus Nomurabacteria bacterium]|nr:HAD family hydrolase [Candidatus Nomurabacteria bacterium]
MKAVITDFSRVLLFPKDDTFTSSLNALNNQLLDKNPDYDFWRYFKINHELLNYYKSLNFPVYIFTSETIQDHPAVKALLEGTFKDIFSAKKLGLSKKEPKSYEDLAKITGHNPNEIFYIDDNYDNFTAAKDGGCKAILFKSNDDVIGKLEIT